MAGNETIDHEMQESGSSGPHGTLDVPTTGGDLRSKQNTDDNLHLHHLKLQIFQDLVGIRTLRHILNTEPSLTNILPQSQCDLETGHSDTIQSSAGGRPQRDFRSLLYTNSTANRGIYGRSIQEELKARIGYNISTYFINFLYILQIFVAATITGLASYRSHGIALTVLGALNTILAGLMALLKGQGLPVRLQRSRDQFQNVMKSIENTERLFARSLDMTPEKEKALDPFQEAQNLQNLYDAAKSDQQNSKCIYFSLRCYRYAKNLFNRHLDGLSVGGARNSTADMARAHRLSGLVREQ